MVYYLYSIMENINNKKENKILYYLENNNLYILLFNQIMAASIVSLYNLIENDLTKENIINIYIDFHKCNYIDSTVIGILIKLHNKLKNKNGKLILNNVNNTILEILKKMGLNNYFNINKDNISGVEEKKYKELYINEDNLPAELILDAHQNIIKVSPSMKKEFETLISILKSQIKK